MIRNFCVAFTALAVLPAALFLLPAVHAASPEATTATVAGATTGTLPTAVIPALRSGKGNNFERRHAENLQRIKEGPIDLLFLGDSITDRWSRSPEIWNANFSKWNAANFGVGGDRTQNVLWRITNGELDGISPKVVVLMIGTNNTHTDSPADIVAGIDRTIEVIQEKLPETEILLHGVFPREPQMKDGVLETMPMDKIRVINKELPKLAEEGKVRYLDISDKFLVDGKVPADVMPDKVHLEEKGYGIWAETITPVLEEMMK